MKKTDQAWQASLTPEQYHILRQQGTEAPFSGEYCHLMAPGRYYCVACGNLLFDAQTKFDSGTGWPSFFETATPNSVRLQTDHRLNQARTEVVCNQCDGHLGHVFNDGPKPTGLRFCMNSRALKFEPSILP